MAARVAQYGREERLGSGTFLFERGQRTVDFFLVLDGSIEILDADVCGNERSLRFTVLDNLPANSIFSMTGRFWSPGGRRAIPAWLESSAWTSDAWSRTSRTSVSSSCEPSS